MKLDLEAAKNATIPDVLPAPGNPFRVLFTGINRSSTPSNSK